MNQAVLLTLPSAGGEGFSWVGLIIPAITFLISFAVTWWLYRHFSSK